MRGQLGTEFQVGSHLASILKVLLHGVAIKEPDDILFSERLCEACSVFPSGKVLDVF